MNTKTSLARFSVLLLTLTLLSGSLYASAQTLPAGQAGLTVSEQTQLASLWYQLESIKSLFSSLKSLFSGSNTPPQSQLAQVVSLSACTHYASPSGGGNGLSQSSPFQIANFWSVASAGKTLCLLDGVYTGSSSMIDPWASGYSSLSGTSGNPITVRALNDGSVTIDGQGARRPIRLNGNSWFVVEGMNAHGANGGGVVQIGGDTGTGSNNIVRRVVAWDGISDDAIFLHNSLTGPNLFEDVAAFGTSRKPFGTISSTNATCRRCWMQLSYSTSFMPKEGFELAYTNSNVLYENAIGTWDMQSGNTGQIQGIFTTGNTQGGGPWHNKVLGSLAYYTSNGTPPANLFYVYEDAELKDVVAYISPGLQSGMSTIVVSGGGSLTDATSIGGAGVNAANRTNVESASTVAGVSSIFSNVPGVSGGANLCYRYVNGVRTSQPLWPWPMDARIRAALIASGRNADTMFGGAGNSVTQQMEKIFGAIPAECRTGGTVTPTVSLTANPTSITSGSASTLSWSSTNATSCTASGGWSGTKSTSGTQSVSPTANSIYTLSCTGTGGSASQSTTVTVTAPQSFNFTLSNGGNKSVTQGSSVSNTVTATLSSGTSQSANFTVSGLPTGATGTFSPTSCSPNCSTTLTISAGASTPTGNSIVTITATAGSVIKTSTFTLTVNAAVVTTIGSCTHYASPSGGGNGLSQTSPFQIANFWSVAGPGKTLCLMDGTYTGGSSMITPPQNLNGSSGNPITIMAFNDGAVRINGEGVREPIRLQNNDYFVIEGMDVHNAGGAGGACHVVDVFRGADNNIFRRIVAWDVPVGTNCMVFLNMDNTGNLFEDVAGFGEARKIFEWYDSGTSKAMTLRRMWGQWSKNTIVGPKETFSFTYNSRNATYENLIGTWDRQPGTAADQHYGIFTGDQVIDGYTYCLNSKILGSIGYVRGADDADTMAGAALGLWNIDCFEYKNLAIYIQPGTHTSLKPISLLSFSQGSRTFANLTNVTTISTASPSIAADWTQTNNSFVSSVAAAPNIWNGSGSQGARVCKQYVNGTLTSNPLWPWPMDARIRAALITSGRNPDAIFGGSGNSVTQQMEALFGTIPSECRTGGIINPTPTVSLSASPSSITSGSASTLSWSSTNATSCTASGGWTGTKATSGSQSTGNLTANTTYTLTCTGAGGSASQSATISVTSPIAFNFTLSNGGNKSVTQGSSVSNTVTATLSSGTSQSANFTVSGLPTGATGTFSPTSCSPNCSTTLTISAGASTPTGNSTITITATAGSVIKTSTFTLTVNAQVSAKFSPNDRVQVSVGGPINVRQTPAGTILGTQAIDNLGTIISGPIAALLNGSNVNWWQIDYDNLPDGWSGEDYLVKYTTTTPIPTVSLTATPSSITSGNSSTLSWSSTNATSCTASGAWSGAKATSGSQSTGTLTSNSTFTITCTGTGGTATQSATVTVTAPITTTGSCTYYASPTGTGNGTLSSPFKIANFWSVAGPGKTLCLMDGVYADSSSTIDPPDNLSGTASAPITVKALNDGKVRIDGQGVRLPVFLNYNNYFVIEGVNANNSSGNVIAIVRGAEHNIIRRVVAWDARDENYGVFGVHYSPNNLLEDVAAFGIARKVISFSQGGDYTVCRRCWARWEGSTNVGPKHTLSTFYNSVGTKIENFIGTWDNGSMPPTYVLQNNGSVYTRGSGAETYTGGAVDQPYGVLSGDRLDNGTNTGVRIYGSIAYIKGGTRYDPAAVVQLGSKDDIQIINSVAYAEPGRYDTKTPLNLLSGANGTALIASDLTSIGARSDSISSQWVRTDVQHASSVDGLSDSIYIGNGSRICYQYVNGAETNIPLWPWPMNQRILEATTLAAAANHQHYIYQGNPPTLTSVNDPHTPVDVTATIESMFGPIPAQCKGSDVIPPPPPPPAPTVSLSASPTSITSGSASTLSWSSTNATSCTASGGWSGTKVTSGTQSTGNLTSNSTYTLSCTGAGGTASQSATVTVTAPVAFNFTLANGGNKSVTQGSSVTNSVTATLSSGTSQSANFTVSGLPTGATASFSQTSCNPTCTTTLNINTLSTTPTGNSTITITAVAGSITKTSTFTLTVNAPSTSGSLSSLKTLSPITMDGSLNESVWPLANSVTFTNSTRSNNTVKALTLWDDTNLYFAYDVTDSQLEALNDITRLWQDDGAEIYLDTQNNKSTTMDANDFALFTNINNLVSPSTITSRTLTKTGGYTMEIKIPWSSISTVPSANKILGLLLTNNDRDGGVIKQFDWQNIISTGSYSQPNLWGSLTLSGTTVGSGVIPAVSLFASPTSITSGSASTLSWSSTNATSCTASGGWTGAKATSGTQSVSPTATTIYTLACTGTGGSASQNTTVTVTTAPVFDFSLSNGGNKSVTQGSSVTNSVTATLSSGTSQSANFTVSGLPTGATGTFSPVSCSPTCTTTLNISTLSTTPTGNSTITITATSGSVIKTSTFTLTVNAPTSTTSGTTLKLDDFESGTIRVVQPTETDCAKYLWWIYCGAGNGASSITTSEKHDGTRSLLHTYTGGNNWQYQFYPYTVGVPGFGTGWQFAKQFVNGTWENNKYNRMRFWIKLPPGISMSGGGRSNFEFGTYIRCSTCDPLSAESNNGHFYHAYDFNTTGQWEQIIVDMHPNHQRSEPGGDEQGNQLHPTGEAGFNYFDLMTRFYLDFPYITGVGFPTPANFYMDGFEFYQETAQENDDQVYSVHGTYLPTNNTIQVGWQRNKLEDLIKHEVRYSYSNIHQIGWNAATPAPNGIVTPLGTGGYNGMSYSTNAISTAGQSIVYIAIKPQNSNLFKQIAIPVNGGSVPVFPAFNFTLTNGGNKSVTQGSSVSNSVTATLSSGTSQSANFTVSGLPTGATGTFSPTSCSPNCSTTLTISAGASTPTGNSTITITATAGSVIKTSTFTLTVNAPATSGSLSSLKTLSPITMDGSLNESVWPLANSVTFTNSTRSNNTVKALTLWDDTNLYFAYDVTDSQLEALNDITRLWQDDGAEIYLDTQNNKSTTMDANDFALFTNINNLVSPSTITSRTLNKTGGYTMEIKIPWSAVSTIPSANKILGLLLTNNDRDGGVIKQFDWMNVIGTGSYAQPNLWGSLALSGTTVGTTQVSIPPADTTAPIISSISSSGIGQSSATITWTTNELSDSQVEYGTTASYGLQTTLNTSRVTSHSQTLSNLSSGTTYHYKVKSRDAATNLATSLDNTFATQPAPDTQAPNTISNLSSSNIQTNSMTLSWSAPSDLPNGGAAATYDIRYSTSPITSANFSSALAVTGEPTPATPGTTQTYILAGLNPSTTYYVSIKSSDSIGNVSLISNVITLATQAPAVTPTPTPTPTATVTPTPTPTPATCSSFTYSSFNVCQPDNTQSRTTTSASPTNCTGGSPVLTQSCTYVSPVTVVTPSTCTFFTYYDWSTCQTNNIQYRSVINASPSGCTGGSPILTQSCTYLPPYSQPTPTPTPTALPTGQAGTQSGGQATPTLPPIAFQVLGASDQIILKWTNPQDSNFVRAVVVRKESSAPSSPSDGLTLYEGTTQEFTDTTAKPGVRYYYAIYALDRNLTPSSPTVISTYLGEKTNVEAEKATSQTVSVPQSTPKKNYFFTKALQLGSRHQDALELQKLLNSLGFIVSTSGAGSKGQETLYFGSLTKQAVSRFQAQYISQVPAKDRGLVGPITRRKLNELSNASASTVSSNTQQTNPASTSQSQIQSIMDQIKELQKKIDALKGR